MKRFRVLLLVVLSSLFVGCAALLMLPDEQTEEFYRKNGSITKEQITKNMTTSTGATIQVSQKTDVRLLPVIYVYTTYNSLKKDEEAYYTSRYTNHSWFRDFMMTAHNAVVSELKKRGLETTFYNESLAQMTNNTDIERIYRTGEARRGTPIRVAAFNVNANTNYGLVDRNKLRSYMSESDKGVVLVQFDVDWDPSSANTMNKDIVLNTTLIMGFNMTICGADACSEVNVPFNKGIRASLFMPNKNTINDDGLSKNHRLVQELHGNHIKQIIQVAFERLDAQGTFVK